MKVKFTIWNTDPVNSQHFYVMNGSLKDCDMSSEGWACVEVGEYEFTPVVPDTSKIVAALEQQKRDIQAEAEMKLVAIDTKINRLLAITME
jgi:hypothetical protein